MARPNINVCALLVTSCDCRSLHCKQYMYTKVPSLIPLLLVAQWKDWIGTNPMVLYGVHNHIQGCNTVYIVSVLSSSTHIMCSSVSVVDGMKLCYVEDGSDGGSV